VAYAEKTRVPVEQSRTEIERLLGKYKATSVAVYTSVDHAAIAFEMRDRRIMFRLGMPKGDDQRAAQSRRQKWRALLLAIKAKLTSVEDGIETFEDAFLAHIVMPDGSTVAEHVRPRIASAYREQKMIPLLPTPNSHHKE
jgi:hypothetical protein